MGKIKREQEIPLSLFYLKYFMYLFISIICIIVGFLLVFEWMVKNNMIYRADFAQEQAKEASKQISKADTIREEMIPDVCQYIVFDMDGNMKSGNLKKLEEMTHGKQCRRIRPILGEIIIRLFKEKGRFVYFNIESFLSINLPPCENISYLHKILSLSI